MLAICVQYLLLCRPTSVRSSHLTCFLGRSWAPTQTPLQVTEFAYKISEVSHERQHGLDVAIG